MGRNPLEEWAHVAPTGQGGLVWENLEDVTVGVKSEG